MSSTVMSTLSRIFQSGSSDGEPSTPDKGKQRKEPTPPTTIYTDGEAMSRKPSSVMSRIRREHGPSQIAWISPSSYHGSGSFSNSPVKHGSNSPTPSPLEPSSSRSRLHPNRKPSLKRMSAESLKFQSVYLSEHSDTSSVRSLPNKQLPPPPEKPRYHLPTPQPNFDPVPRTPESTRADNHSLSSHPTFLSRPIRRTTSQTSTLSNAGSIAPFTPHFEFHHPFASTHSLPPRKSNLPQPTLPTVIGSPRPNVTVSIILENPSTPSFRTAASTDSDPEIDVSDAVEEEPRVSQFRETYFSSSVDDSGSSITEHDDEELEILAEGTPPDDMILEVDLGIPPPSSTLVDRSFAEAITPTPAFIPTPLADIRSEHSFETATTTTAAVESRIHDRWLKGLSYGSAKFQKPGEKQSFRVTSAVVLFWVGFVAPWCWLIGGWYLSRSGEVDPEGQFLDTVTPQWPRKGYQDTYGYGYGDNVGSTHTNLGGKAESRKAPWGKKLTTLWRQPAGTHSKETLPLSPQDHTQLPPASNGPSIILDPWVRRCRIAAVISGALLVVACIVIVIIVAR